jgi:DNA-binding transcriptional LysR family regulator
LRLGVGHTLATYLLPDLLRRYRALYPQRLARISVGNTAELLDLVATDTVELALVGSGPEHPKVLVTPFMNDRLVVIVAPGDVWATREWVALEELGERLLLTREPGSALHAAVERLLVQGIAVEREVAAGTLRALPLHGGDAGRTYAYAHRAGRELSAAAHDLVALLGNGR